MMRRNTRAGLRPSRDAGWLAEANPSDRLFVTSMRRWLDGPSGQADVWNGLARALGAARARTVLKEFERLLRELAGSARRKLERHATECPCLGEDEALLAGMVRAAGAGDTETARALAAGIVREADLIAVVEAAARLGRQMDNVAGGPVTGIEARVTLH